MCSRSILLCCCLVSLADVAHAQRDLDVFGYFQGSFKYENHEAAGDVTSFNAQQLNLLLQRDLSERWTAFANVEAVNSYSSIRRWGGLSLDELWAQFYGGRHFRLKLGLQTPPFNHLNEIKNRTPLLPYVIRPLAYEESFGEIFNLEEFVPERAFAQVSGIVPTGLVRVDYAVYLGNSPDVNDLPERGQTGIDTTDTFLVGARFGLRVGENVKAGISYTQDRINGLAALAEPLGLAREDLLGVPRRRYGGDFMLNVGRFYGAAEAIYVDYDEDVEGVELHRAFYYATVGVHVTDLVFVYGSYWYSDEDATLRALGGENNRLRVPNAGAALSLPNGITLKTQAGHVRVRDEVNGVDLGRFSIVTTAISVLF